MSIVYNTNTQYMTGEKGVNLRKRPLMRKFRQQRRRNLQDSNQIETSKQNNIKRLRLKNSPDKLIDSRRFSRLAAPRGIHLQSSYLVKSVNNSNPLEVLKGRYSNSLENSRVYQSKIHKLPNNFIPNIYHSQIQRGNNVIFHRSPMTIKQYNVHQSPIYLNSSQLTESSKKLGYNIQPSSKSPNKKIVVNGIVSFWDDNVKSLPNSENYQYNSVNSSINEENNRSLYIEPKKLHYSPKEMNEVQSNSLEYGRYEINKYQSNPIQRNKRGDNNSQYNPSLDLEAFEDSDFNIAIKTMYKGTNKDTEQSERGDLNFCENREDLKQYNSSGRIDYEEEINNSRNSPSKSSVIDEKLKFIKKTIEEIEAKIEYDSQQLLQNQQEKSIKEKSRKTLNNKNFSKSRISSIGNLLI